MLYTSCMSSVAAKWRKRKASLDLVGKAFMNLFCVVAMSHAVVVGDPADSPFGQQTWKITAKHVNGNTPVLVGEFRISNDPLRMFHGQLRLSCLSFKAFQRKPSFQSSYPALCRSFEMHQIPYYHGFSIQRWSPSEAPINPTEIAQKSMKNKPSGEAPDVTCLLQPCAFEPQAAGVLMCFDVSFYVFLTVCQANGCHFEHKSGIIPKQRRSQVFLRKQ